MFLDPEKVAATNKAVLGLARANRFVSKGHLQVRLERSERIPLFLSRRPSGT
jgi:hypothetical protein